MEVKIEVVRNQNNTFLIKFSPFENNWKFPNNKRLKLFNQIHSVLSNYEHDPKILDHASHPYSYDLNVVIEDIMPKIESEIREILASWIEQGDLIIE